MVSKHTEYKKRRLVALTSELVKLREHNEELQQMVRERDFTITQLERRIESVLRK